jgi:hypothetical protein
MPLFPSLAALTMLSLITHKKTVISLFSGAYDLMQVNCRATFLVSQAACVTLSVKLVTHFVTLHYLEG